MQPFSAGIFRSRKVCPEETSRSRSKERQERHSRSDSLSLGLLGPLWSHMCHGQARPYIGDGHPTFNRNPYTGYINPYYWVDDHPLLYGNNGSLSLDPGTHSSTKNRMKSTLLLGISPGTPK